MRRTTWETMATQRKCSSCDIAIQTGEKVAMEVEGIYRGLSSTVVFALQKSTVKYIEGTLCHADCPRNEVQSPMGEEA